jgi:hypothetical protein
MQLTTFPILGSDTFGMKVSIDGSVILKQTSVFSDK